MVDIFSKSNIPVKVIEVSKPLLGKLFLFRSFIGRKKSLLSFRFFKFIFTLKNILGVKKRKYFKNHAILIPSKMNAF
jgi:hypothetical protein